MKPLTLTYSTVVIVDGYNVSADVLADRFRSLGAKVHVVSNSGAAAVLVRNKKVDVVFVGYRLEGGNALVQVLNAYGVPYITCATPSDMKNLAVEFKGVDDLVGA